MSDQNAGAGPSKVSTGSASSASAGQNECDAETSVTMLDVLREESEIEQHSKAVLGGSDHANCTYAEGYVKRQALYSCLTCCPDATKRCGVCLACSYKCHENHTLVELYTKRNFRCDCGTARMTGVKCVLDPIKMDDNSMNVYNQNFSGLYCTCQRPYPDPESTITDDMLQCCICEDWLHGRHLNAAVPKAAEYNEMICEDCMKRHEFLHSYVGLCVKPREPDSADSADVSIVANTSGEGDLLENELNKSVEGIISINKSNDIENDEPVSKKSKIEDELVADDQCKRVTNEIVTYAEGATFWPNQWRQHLCKCSKCMAIYSEFKVEYLLDGEDTVQRYVERGRNNDPDTEYDRGMKALSTLGHTSQIDAIASYNSMKSKLMDYLQSFVVNRKTVTEDDIKEFFKSMEEEKKKKADARSQPSSSCR